MVGSARIDQVKRARKVNAEARGPAARKAEPWRTQKMPNDEMPSEEQLRGIFKVIGEEVPELLEKLTKILYGPRRARSSGRPSGPSTGPSRRRG